MSMSRRALVLASPLVLASALALALASAPGCGGGADGGSDSGLDSAAADVVGDGADAGPDAGPDAAPDIGDAAADTSPDIPADTAPDDVAPPAPRQPGERAPRTGACDPADPSLCLLPWPSNVFAAADGGTETGLRLAVDGASLPAEDPPGLLARADGFSRISPIITAFPTSLDAATVADDVVDQSFALLVAEGPRAGAREPVRCYAKNPDAAGVIAGEAGTLACYPRHPLAPNTEHLAVVLDGLRTQDQAALTPDRLTQVSAGVEAPADADEAALAAYHAPGRAALAAAGIDPSRVVRMWDFTTRSEGDARADLLRLRELALAAVAAGDVGVAVDDVEVAPKEGVAVVVTGRLTGLPSALEPEPSLEASALRRGADGLPEAVGTHDAPFRAVVPVGEGDYRVVMYCHGTGGSVHDGSFDSLMASHGALKLGIEIDGWTEATLPDTLAGLLHPYGGVDRITARVLESLAGAEAVFAALDGVLGDTLAAAQVGGVDNPAVGRRPSLDTPVWAGGSLGGTMGLVFGYLEPAIAGGVLNVPGAGFSHWLPTSSYYGLVELGLEGRFDGPAALNLAIAMAQTLFDPMDGAIWADPAASKVFLVQISQGDPILPNVGGELVATSVDAVEVGAELWPIVGLEHADEAVGRSAVTQFHVPGEGLHVHGFAAEDTPGGQAARQQFIDFVETLWAGAPRIEVPTLCQENTPAGSCDFTAPATQ